MRNDRPNRRRAAALTAGVAFGIALAVTTPALPQEAPASVIPWLSDSLAQPRAPRDEPPASAVTETEITVLPLGQTRRDAVGLLPTSLTGLPRDTFAGSDPARLADLFARQPVDAMPPMQALVSMLLLAELDPPRASIDPDRLFFARIDGLLRLGQLEQAQALMERAGATDPDAFRRWFDISLLTGFDTRACDAMGANPGIAPTLPARIFCLTRGGDWAAAALTLDTGRALGAITEEEDALLGHFLEPELFEGLPPPVPPRPMTPLAFRLLDGIGETPATGPLPLAFAVSDLRSTVGWKAQIEAAERLARAGALDPNRLLALYTERKPAASGGVWDRAEAIQRLDAALLARQPEAVANALPGALARMRDAGLTALLAELYGGRVAGLDLPAAARLLGLRLGLLSSDFEIVARQAIDRGITLQPRDAFAVALATGDLSAPPPPGALPRAISDGMTGDAPQALLSLAGEGRLGEALLMVGTTLANGTSSDPGDVAEALAFLRAVGLQSTARRLALHLLLT